MDIKEILYVALATILVMVVLQVVTFMVTRMIYPPEPKIVYRDVPVQAPVQAPVSHVQFAPQNGPTFIQPKQEIQLPEYEPRQQATTSVRLDPELPPGIQETRPPGT